MLFFFSFGVLTEILNVCKAVAEMREVRTPVASVDLDMWCQTESPELDEGRRRLLLFKPGWTLATRHFQLDVELLQCLFQLLLVPSIVRRYSVMEQDELVVQHLHLRGSNERRENR